MSKIHFDSHQFVRQQDRIIVEICLNLPSITIIFALSNMLLSSWIDIPNDSDFTLQNCPFGVFSPANSTDRRCCTVVGNTIVDLSILEEAGVFDDFLPPGIFRGAVLNSFLECRPCVWHSVRTRLIDLLSDREGSDARLKENKNLQRAVFYPLKKATLHLPIQVGDYRNFYASRQHSTNVDSMFCGKDNALQPKLMHIPEGYNGCSSTIYVSGHSFPRPTVQVWKNSADPSEGSVCVPSEQLDFEFQVAAIVGGPPNQGTIDIFQAKERIFGFMLVNDWSVRDIQNGDHVAFSSFTSKNFATTVSPWIIPAEALEPFCAPISVKTQHNPEPLEYISSPEHSFYDIQFTVEIKPDGDESPHEVSRSNFRHHYWKPPHQLVHHSATGCFMRAGDMLGSGRVSETGPASFVSMLDLSWKGTKEVPVGNQTRKFLHDGDAVIMRAWCKKDECGRIGFGKCCTKILPAGTAISIPGHTTPATSRRYQDFKLYGYWRSSSTWRVRMVLRYKGVPYETIPVSLTKKENLCSGYKDINSAAQIPSLECIDSETGRTIRLSQSIAIIAFLEDNFPDKRSIYPKHAIQRARVKEMAEIVNSGIQPLQNLFYLERLEIKSGGTISTKDQAHDVIKKGLEMLEGLARQHQIDFCGPCCAGTFAPTLADFCVLPQLVNARRVNVNVDSVCPHLLRVENMLKDTSWYKLSSPQAQPDSNN